MMLLSIVLHSVKNNLKLFQFKRSIYTAIFAYKEEI